ncbi:MAG: hypothetical protein IE917_06760 [Betaproteobacteria bacterium]|nr:hypothetical protein [Betaproteobacteria bacterium]
MKQMLKWTSLVLVLSVSCVVSAGAGYWYAGKKLGDAFLLIQDTVFMSQVQALKQLQEGSNSEALEYLRAMNELGIVRAARNFQEKGELPLIDLPTIKYACSDLEGHPTSWFSTARARRAEVSQACQILLNQTKGKRSE